MPDAVPSPGNLDPHTFVGLQTSWPPRYLTDHDHLKLTVLTSVAVTVRLRGLHLSIDVGVPQEFEKDFVVAVIDRSPQTLIVPMQEGWLIEAQAFVAVGAPQDGQTYVFVSVVRGSAASALELQPLAANYVTAKQRLAWPGGVSKGFLEGGGALRSITGAVPGAGAEISETVPTGARWELLAGAFTFTTAVAVANRTPRLSIDDGALVYFQASSQGVQAASITVIYTFGPGLPLQAIGGDARSILTLPVGLSLAAGHHWRTLTGLIQAADQYSAIQYLVRERIDGT